MNSKVHGVIVQCLEKYLESDVLAVLNQEINYEAWQKVRNDLGLTEAEIGSNAHTYLDIMVQGAIDEDNCNLITDIEDPDAEASAIGCLLIDAKGANQHWLGHFWNDNMTIESSDASQKCGFSTTHDYIMDIVGELTGLNYLKTYLEINNIVSSTLECGIAAVVEGALALVYNTSKVFDSYHSAPYRASKYWSVLLKNYKDGEKERAYYNLGKVCHLLADVGTPAHMHGDGHMGVNLLEKLLDILNIDCDCNDLFTIDDDQYECYTGEIIEGSLVNDVITSSAMPDRWLTDKKYFAPVYNNKYELFDYFKSLGNISVQYDSDDADGTGYAEPYHYEHFDLLNFDSYTHKLARNVNDDLTEAACDQIAQNLIPATIAHTVGVVYLFMDKAEICSIPVKQYHFEAQNAHIYEDEDNAGAGELYFDFNVNGKNGGRIGRIKAKSGDNIDFTKKKFKNITDFDVTENGEGNIIVKTICYDNDDWTVLGHTIHKASDSLGQTEKVYDRNILPTLGNTIQDRLKSSNGDYDITYQITHTSDSTKKENLKLLFRSMKKADKNAFLKHIINDPHPFYINLSTGRIHSTNSKNKVCEKFSKSEGKKLGLLIFPEEINKKINITVEQSNKNLQNFVSHLKDDNLRNEIKKIIESDKYKEFLEGQKGVTTIFDKIKNKVSERERNVLDKINDNNIFEGLSTECACCNDKKTRYYLDVINGVK